MCKQIYRYSFWRKSFNALTTEHFKEFDKKGWMYRQAITDSIRDWVGPGYMGSFYDAYSPEARKLFWGQMRDHYYPLGFDAWWMDASEPNIRDCTDIQYRKDLCGPTALGHGRMPKHKRIVKMPRGISVAVTRWKCLLC